MSGGDHGKEFNNVSGRAGKKLAELGLAMRQIGVLDLKF